ncbi:hypothetical protein C8A01DRAFT_40413 [Parachaetomium inaequale]|uniref:Uncharacterized protein n=1 Tax=Parachaetomium inaequale TaxID=2588326 RepID=A0AAN6PB67_9PEZI|nr:hypothetical protein C8A01DRAFT_40413 [Parachaetomium inaequale]
MPRRRLALWAASIAAVHTAASAVPMNELFMRQSSCAPNFDRCKNPDFPDYFCCKPGNTCIALAGNTTVLCCPEGSDCLRIQPVPCNLSLQDGEKNPDAVVKTTALGGTLGRCGTQCCPFGYSCDKEQCVMDQNQNAVPIQTNTAKPGPTTTAGANPSLTSDASPTPDTTSPADDPNATTGASDGASTSGSSTPVAAIAGGVTAAAVVLIGAAVLAFIFLRKKKKKEPSQAGSPPKFSRSTSSFGNLISNPIIADNSFLSDFARAPGPGPGQRQPPEDPDSVTGAVLDSSVNSPEAGPMPAVPLAAALGPDPQGGGAGYGGYGGLEPSQFVDMPYVDHDNGLMPQTPRQHREPSSVSINVFADPNITPDRTPESNADRRYTNMTTFTQMLDNADLGGMARGESYLPYGQNGGQVPPMPGR